jgi:hypothetical protein
MNAPSYEQIKERMKHALQLLACTAETQFQLHPPLVCVADELALNFDNWCLACIGDYGSELTPDQVSSLAIINEKLDSFGESVEDFWTDEAVHNSAQWESIRKLAAQALRTFGWPTDVPPSYAHEYVKNEPNLKD